MCACGLSLQEKTFGYLVKSLCWWRGSFQPSINLRMLAPFFRNLMSLFRSYDEERRFAWTARGEKNRIDFWTWGLYNNCNMILTRAVISPLFSYPRLRFIMRLIKLISRLIILNSNNCFIQVVVSLQENGSQAVTLIFIKYMINGETLLK